MLTNQIVRATYQGNGVTLVFPIPFGIINDDSEEVKVWRRDETDPLAITETLLSEGVHYNLTGASPPGVPFATDVTFLVAPTANHKVLVIRDVPETQASDYLETSEFPAEVHEKNLDKIVALVQDLKDVARRSLKIRVSDPHAAELPQPADTTVIGWDDSAPQELRNYTPDDLMSLAGALLIANNLSDLSSVATALANLGIDPFKTTVLASIANNQVAAADVVGMEGIGATHRAVVFFYNIQRRTDDKDSGGVGMLILFRVASGAWQMEVGPFWHYNDDVVGDPAGVTFSLLSAGDDVQVQYQSHDLTGANYDGDIKFSGKYFAV